MMAKAGAQSAGSGLGFQAKNLIDRPEKSWRPVVIILLAQVPVYQSPSAIWHGCTVFSLLASRACCVGCRQRFPLIPSSTFAGA